MLQNIRHILLFCLLTFQNLVNCDDQNWNAKWFPYSPDVKKDTSPTFEIRKNLYDPTHGVLMGESNLNCDDGKTNLQIDWDFNPVNYTCFIMDRKQFKVNSDLPAIYSQEHIPPFYNAQHKCMDVPIEYNSIIPTFGTHRPLWPKYGEYTFLPWQRWLHNLEHGAVVMLYHPCAEKNEVNLLRNLVNKCLYRHVITPYNLLTPERPLALVSWGHRLEMAKVSPELVIDFIRKHALNGPEQTARDGQYNLMLEKHADIVSDLNDSNLCGFYNFIE